jgi:predicted acyl esterase
MSRCTWPPFKGIGVPFLLTSLFLLSFGAVAFEGPHAQFVGMNDGLGIDLDLRWPEGPPPKDGWPAILLAHSRRGHKGHLAEEGAYYAERGYVTLAYSCRGDGASTEGGDAKDTSAARRGEDVAELVAWLVDEMPNDVPSSQVRVHPKKIGMTGASQGALNTWYGIMAEPRLAAAVPQVFALNTWKRGFSQEGSIVFRLQRLKMTHPLLATHNTQALAAMAKANSVAHRIIDVKAPVMIQASMLDIWGSANDAIADFQAMDASVPKAIYIGTGGHGTPDTDEDYRDQCLRDAWFDRFLKGEEQAIPRIHVSLLDSLEKVTFDAFPHPKEQRVRLFLDSEARLTATAPTGVEQADTLVNDPDGYTLANALADGFEQTAILSHLPQGKVNYQTIPLTEEVVVLGIPSVRLFVDGTAPSKYQVNIHLTDNAPDSPLRLLAWGTCLVDKSAHPEDALVEVKLSYTGRRIRKGHRIGLGVSNLDLEVLTPGEEPVLRHLPYLEHSVNKVYRDHARPSSLSLPVIEGALR